MSDLPKGLPQHALPRGLAGKFIYLIMPPMHKGIYQNVARVADLRTHDDLLDVACGNGHFLRKYASHVRSVAGLDLSPIGIDSANKKSADRVAAGTANFVCSDGSELPWDDERFTVVTEMGTLPVFPDPTRTLEEMHRVLRPGGRAVLCVTWNAEDGKDHSKDAESYGYRVWSESEVRTMVQNAGFSGVEVTYAKAGGIPKMMLVQAFKPNT